ncbi:MAG: phosphatase PAP2 family protein [Bacteroidetes bacterium]|nr:phosphatase PAP2 family protein [Bacteroidota bacterium]
MKHIISILILIQTIAAQDIGKSRIIQSLTAVQDGFVSSLEWQDVPVATLYLSRHIINNSSFGDFIIVPPTSFDLDISKSFSATDRSSPGSIDKDLIPHTIFLGRLGINFALDLLTDREISGSPYKSAFLFQKSLIYTYTVTEIAKTIFKRERPDNSDTRSFFSGHTSTTFAGATFLFLELNDIYTNTKWIVENKYLLKAIQTTTFACLYGWAGYVGYCRIQDNRHYLSDVLIGASIGTVISYILHQSYFCEDDSFLKDLSIESLQDRLLLSYSLRF